MHKTTNPHLKVLSRTNMMARISFQLNEVKKSLGVQKLSLLDIGGGKGFGLKEFGKRPDVDYHVLDLATRHNTPEVTFHRGDITDPNLFIGQHFHVIFTKDTYEHILNPWDSTANILAMLKEGGRFIFMAPFSWRYHASPYDTFRYTHTGARYLFERLGGMRCIETAYIPFGDVGGFWKNRKDFTLDGKPFPKCLETYYVAQRVNGLAFDKTTLDVDKSDRHTE